MAGLELDQFGGRCSEVRIVSDRLHNGAGRRRIPPVRFGGLASVLTIDRGCPAQTSFRCELERVEFARGDPDLFVADHRDVGGHSMIWSASAVANVG